MRTKPGRMRLPAGWSNDLQNVTVRNLTGYNIAVAQLRSAVSLGGGKGGGVAAVICKAGSVPDSVGVPGP